MLGFLQPRILCPACKTGQLAMGSNSGAEVHCADCRASFPMKNGVIDLLPEFSYRRTLSQSIMEWEPFIEIFEGKWFRRGPGFHLISGISFDEEYEIITRAARLKGDEILLDLGCGTGIYSRPIAQSLNRGIVVGLDLSVPMLRYASSRALDEGLENLIFIRGNALNLPFPDNEFDAVISCATIHLFSVPDLIKVFKEVNRILKPGGRFATTCLRQLIGGQLARNISEFWQRITGTNYFRPEHLDPLFKEAGLENVECHHAKRYWLTMSAVKPN